MAEFKRVANIIPLTRVKLRGPQIFTYLVPLKLYDQLRPGQIVKIPFGSRKILGVTTSFEMHRLRAEVKGFKEIEDLIDAIPALSQSSLTLAEWISKRYVVSLGVALKAMLPKFASKPKTPDIVGYERFNPDFVLTEHQRLAVTQISNSLDKKMTFLLKGVTGSGKTEVYMQIIARVLEHGRQVIILVPEISLTAQAIERFARRYGMPQVALLHSKLRDSEKLWMWQKIRGGEKKIIIGPRSAIFSPVQNLGLIILDEEHDPSFKQFDQSPKYHARAVAEKLSQLWSCPLILGDATPSVESYDRSQKGEISLLTLPYRIKADLEMPKVQIVDLKEERRAHNQSIFSEYLKLAILDTLKAGRQIILFLNRRGSSPVVMCRDCGANPMCPDCTAPLVWHNSIQRLVCHHCGKRYPLPATCPNCGSTSFGFWGTGTQSVEEELKKFLASVLKGSKMPVTQRMDMDTTAKTEDSDRIYQEWTKGKIRILIGTQIISKGWDVSHVGLVGIVLADTILHLPDFRSNERTFQVLTQVAGRTGRGTEQGLVILQTYMPGNYAIQSVKSHNYEKFFESEVAFREKYFYPPFSRLVKLTFEHEDSEQAENKARNAFRHLLSKRDTRMEIVGPVPAFIFKLRGRYRFQIILKLPAAADFDLFGLLSDLSSDTSIDVDPENLL